MYFWLRILILLLIALPARAELILFQSHNLVLDNTNSLMWLNYPLPSAAWDNQSSAASSATNQGFTDWRLATTTEMALLQDTDSLPQLDSKFILGPVRNWTLWTSSAVPADIAKNYILSSRYYAFAFLDLTTVNASKLQHYPTLFVRDVPDYYITDSASRYLINSNGDFLISGD